MAKQPSIQDAERILNSQGDTSGFNQATWSALQQIEQDNRTQSAWGQLRGPQYNYPSVSPAAAAEDDDDDTTTYDYNTDPETMRMRDQQKFETDMRNKQEADRVKNAIAVIKDLSTQYGLDSLYNKMVDYIKQGYNDDAIMSLVRDTQEYKDRFPAMAALIAKNRAITEGAYVEYERNAAQLETMYGLPKGMITGSVTQLLTNEISAEELNDRVVLSSAASVSAPQELKDTLKNYYGIDSGGLAAYFLDPEIARPLLEKQFATAIIGTEALRQDVDLGVDIAGNLQELGVTQDEAREGFGQVKRFETFTQGRGDTVSKKNLVKGTFGQQDAATEIERAQKGRTAKFQGGGGFVSGESGVSGLRSSAT